MDLNMNKKLLLIGLLLSGFAQASCFNLYPQSKQITVPNTTELCNSSFVTVYDDKKNAPLFSSEKIAKGSKFDITRTNNFHSDDRLHNPVLNKIYVASNYDKGHLTPADDATSNSSMSETFLLSNMTPQSPKLNRGAWKALETSVRDQSKAEDLTIVTGAIYQNIVPMGNTLIPTQYYKIVYGKKTTAFTAINSNSAKVVTSSVNEVNSLTGLKFPQ